MVDTLKCDHCGAEANAKYVITKEFDGKTLNFCCRGCLQVYELMREETSLQKPDTEKLTKENSSKIIRQSLR